MDVVVHDKRIAEAATRCASHALLFTFTLLLVRKLDHLFFGAWWLVFSPLWLFHAHFHQWRFSIPAPLGLHDFHWPPFHADVATPLFFSFEFLLCVYLEISHVVSLKIVFLPVVLFEIIIIVDNFRMCFSPMLEERGDLSVNFPSKKITHCLIIVSMSFIVGATVLMVLMLSGDTTTVNWWHPYSVFSVGQCLALIVFTKWSYPVIDKYSQTRLRSSSSGITDHTNSSVSEVEEKWSLQDIGGHVMKGLIIAFQLLLCMHLQGTPGRASEFPFRIIFSPLLLLQGVGVLISTLQLLERIGNQPLPIGVGNGQYYRFSSTAQDFLEFILHGSRLLGWWLIDEADPQIHHCVSGFYTTYSYWDNPLGVLKQMSKRDLVEEVFTLQVTLNGLIKSAKSCEKDHEQLRNKRILCRICSEREIDVVLLPCKHWVICRSCFVAHTRCPVCRYLVNRVVHVVREDVNQKT